MEGNLSRSYELSCSSRTHSIHLPSPAHHRRRCGYDSHILWLDQGVSLAPLHGFSPVIRSLHLTFTSLPNSKVFDFICSFPLLEDLALVSRTRRDSDMPWNPPSTSPRITGSLELQLIEGIQFTACRLLDFPNGLHFTKIAVRWRSGGDVLSTMHLVSRCSGTLRSLDIADHLSGVFFSTLVPD